MAKILIIANVLVWTFVICCTGCSWHNFAPTAGAGIGAGIGSVGGVPGAIGGGLAGGAVGQIIEKSHDEEVEAKIDAVDDFLNRGDATKLIEQQMGDQKGWVEETIDGVINLIILCVIGLVLWNVVPILYSRFLHKKMKIEKPPRIFK